MDTLLVAIALSCASLAVLVYFMYRSATRPDWQSFAQGEKKRWRHDEEKRKEA